MRNLHKSFSPRSSLIAGLFLCFAVLTATIFGQDEPLRVDTQLISVPVSVLDRSGRYVSGLKKEDFRLWEDGVEQQVADWKTTEEAISVLFLIDISGSMTDFLPRVASDVSLFAGKLNLSDSVAVAVFGNDSKIFFRTEMTKKQFLSLPIYLKNSPIPARSGRPLPNTPVYDGVDLGMKYMGRLSGRLAIVLFTDSELYGEKVTAMDNLKAAEETNAMIYPIQYGKYPRTCVISDGLWNVPNETTNGSSHDIVSRSDIERFGRDCRVPPKDIPVLEKKVKAYLSGLAERSGGRAFQIGDIQDLNSTFSEIQNELAQQYTLAYYPSQNGKDGERRRITVKVNVPNVAVRSRNEVVYKKPKK